MNEAGTVVIAGASGFIGGNFRRRLQELGWTVRTIGRTPRGSGPGPHAHGRTFRARGGSGAGNDAGSDAGRDVAWGDTAGIIAVLEGADLLVNLAGKSVSCRYTAANRAEILRSRTETTAELGRAVAACFEPPADWFNASTGTIYRHAEDHPQDETDGELGTGFSVDVSKAWEQSLEGAQTPRTRKIPLRITIVMGPGGGVMRPFNILARLGLGGRMSNGRQKYSWVHVDDLLRAVLFLHGSPAIRGPVNIASPNPVNNKELMAEVRHALRIPFGVPTPAWLLRMGAVLIRTETELVLKSRWVQPGKLLDAGFDFRYPSLREALADIMGSGRG